MDSRRRFLIVGSTTAFVLYPRRVRQDLGVDAMKAWFDIADLQGVAHIVRGAIDAHGANYKDNHNTVRWLHRGLSVAVAGLILETVALTAELVL